MDIEDDEDDDYEEHEEHEVIETFSCKVCGEDGFVAWQLDTGVCDECVARGLWRLH